MKLKAYAILDTAAGAYNTPFFMQNDGMALRAFTDTGNSEDSLVGKHPDQFYLYRIGSYDDSSGELIPETPYSLGCAINFVNPKDADQLQLVFEAVERVEKKLREVL